MMHRLRSAPGAADQFDHHIDGEALSEHRRLSAAVAARREQFERAAALRLEEMRRCRHVKRAGSTVRQQSVGSVRSIVDAQKAARKSRAAFWFLLTHCSMKHESVVGNLRSSEAL